MVGSASRVVGSSPLARGKHGHGAAHLGEVGIIPACAGETGAGRPTGGARPDHPRLRGGNDGVPSPPGSHTGSSPLARGKRRRRHHLPGGSGIIPACAGETRPRGRPSRRGRDHPRLRGGNVGAALGVEPWEGSSPLARGKPHHAGQHADGPGIIPACAGETASSCDSRPWRRDHPRLRGGNGRRCTSWVTPPGSSPLARGKRPRRRETPRERGIIPACAGETIRVDSDRICEQDHPRLRGGNRVAWSVGMRAPGSSPLARGKRGRTSRRSLRVRIIPACAGETPRWRPGSCACSDHPRLRGGNWVIEQPMATTGGSSPLARGKRSQLRCGLAQRRIIPACAGETGRSPRRRWGPRDHPRLRGGNSAPRPSTSSRRGSSPLARGKLEPGVGAPQAGGIIPACAGETPAISSAETKPSGSSPLARGKRILRDAARTATRIIPACAGETTPPPRRRTPRWDHPRLRGGN